MSKLVKFNTDPSLDAEIALIRHNKKIATNSGAAKYALAEFLNTENQYFKSRAEIAELKHRLEKAESILSLFADFQFNLRNYKDVR